ncbi:uncharacterized protein LOC111403546 [Olea europaea var. sylvestris]|uniref:uncharacterized protein LOC111403546 n=1 Tax=Olea europaea var. sylvestris TaxID=158386 RepID=UPI000C1D4708|nr:uncharacterized protein LOC111403546 [Olea europaea var. sylvestris]
MEFFNKLKKAYGNREGLCFVSDRHPSIKNAIEHVYPEACTSDQNIIQAFNSVVRAYTLEEYDYNMSLLTMMNEKIISYLADVGPEKWSRIHMATYRYSTMTSNIVESVNTVTKAANNYPIVSLLVSLRQTIQSWFCKHRDYVHGTFTKLSNKYKKEIRKMSMDLRNLRLSVNGTNLCNLISKSVTYVMLYVIEIVFSVSNERSTFVVDIEQRTCTYRITNTKRDPYDYCSYYYTKDAYLNAYQDSVYPIGNQEEWIVPGEV